MDSIPFPNKHFYRGKLPISNCFTPGIRLWSNGFPIKVDTYRSCSNLCHYCLARVQSAAMTERSGIRHDQRICRYMSVGELNRALGKARQPDGWMGWALRGKYFIEAGTLCEMFQEADISVRSTWNFLQATRALKIPLIVNTKGNLLCKSDEYFQLFATHPVPVIVNLSFTTYDDNDARANEPFAPLPSERVKLIRRLRDHGIPTTIYLAPYMPDITGKDLPGIVRRSIDAGAVALHLRNFYLTGKHFRTRRWTRYVADNKAVLSRDGMVWKVSRTEMMRAFDVMREEAEKIDPRFKVLGMKTEWFEMEPYHGRMPMDSLPDQFQAGIIDFTAIPILRKVREALSQPQTLLWSKIGYKESLIDLPRTVYLSGDDEATWMACSCLGAPKVPTASAVKLLETGYNWLRMGLWNGTKDFGFIQTVGMIWPVVSANGLPATESGGDRIYAFVPRELEKELITDYGNTTGVSESLASTFLVPERAGGTEDKFYPPEKREIWYDDFNAHWI